MNDLKDRLIRLGSEKPELRKHLRPVLDKISGRFDSSGEDGWFAYIVFDVNQDQIDDFDWFMYDLGAADKRIPGFQPDDPWKKMNKGDVMRYVFTTSPQDSKRDARYFTHGAEDYIETWERDTENTGIVYSKIGLCSTGNLDGMKRFLNRM
jgi:hypothetical protein